MAPWKSGIFFWMAIIVEQVAGGIVVHGIHDPVRITNEPCCIALINPGIDGMDRDIRVDCREFLFGRYRLLLPDIAVGMEDLAVQVRLVDNVHVYDGDRPDPCNRKVEGDR